MLHNCKKDPFLRESAQPVKQQHKASPSMPVSLFCELRIKGVPQTGN